MGNYSVSFNFRNLNDFSSVHLATMSPWVHESFKQTLIDSSEAYLNSHDRGPHKDRTIKIIEVCDKVKKIAKEANVLLPSDLQKVNFVLIFSIINQLISLGRSDMVSEQRRQLRNWPSKVKKRDSESPRPSQDLECAGSI